MIELSRTFERLGERGEGGLFGGKIFVTSNVNGDQAGESYVGIVGG